MVVKISCEVAWSKYCPIFGTQRLGIASFISLRSRVEQYYLNSAARIQCSLSSRRGSIPNKSFRSSNLSLASRGPVIFHLPTSPHLTAFPTFLSTPHSCYSILLPRFILQKLPCVPPPTSSSASRASPSSRAPTAPSASRSANNSNEPGTSARVSNTEKSTFLRPKRTERMESNGKKNIKMRFRLCKLRRLGSWKG